MESFCRFIDGDNNDYLGTDIEDSILGMEVLHAISRSVVSETVEKI